jgi:hypothetical protein
MERPSPGALQASQGAAIVPSVALAEAGGLALDREPLGGTRPADYARPMRSPERSAATQSALLLIVLPVLVAYVVASYALSAWQRTKLPELPAEARQDAEPEPSPAPVPRTGEAGPADPQPLAGSPAPASPEAEPAEEAAPSAADPQPTPPLAPASPPSPRVERSGPRTTAERDHELDRLREEVDRLQGEQRALRAAHSAALARADARILRLEERLLASLEPAQRDFSRVGAPDGRVLGEGTGWLLLDLGRRHGVFMGSRLELLRPDGDAHRSLGWLEVTELQEERCRATPVGELAEGSRPGDLVRSVLVSRQGPVTVGVVGHPTTGRHSLDEVRARLTDLGALVEPGLGAHTDVLVALGRPTAEEAHTVRLAALYEVPVLSEADLLKALGWD